MLAISFKGNNSAPEKMVVDFHFFSYGLRLVHMFFTLGVTSEVRAYLISVYSLVSPVQNHTTPCICGVENAFTDLFQLSVRL